MALLEAPPLPTPACFGPSHPIHSGEKRLGGVGPGGAGEPVGTSAEGMKRPPVPHGPGGWVLAPEFLHSTSIKGEMLATIPLRTRTRQSFPLSLLQHVLEVPALGPFLVSLGCWNKAPQTFIFLQSWRPEVQGQGTSWSVSQEGSSPSSQSAVFSLLPHTAESEPASSLRAHPVRALMPPREPHPHALV